MRAALLCDLIDERWPSMDRYALTLHRTLAALYPNLSLQLVRPSHPLSGARGRMDRLATLSWKHLVYPLQAATLHADIYHICDHSYAHLAAFLPRRRLVITCHDLAPLALGDSPRPLSMRLWRHSIQYLASAAHIITPSANTANDLTRFLRIAAEKISVIPYGLGPEFHPAKERGAALRHTLGIPDDVAVVLHIGSCAPRKNMPVLLQALASLSTPFLFLQVGGRFSSDEQLILEKNGLAARVRQISAVPLDQVVDYYAAANVLVFPSLYEGFGWPVLEAMACGTPVIAANTSSLPEVVGDAGLLVAPDDPRELAAALVRVLSEPGLAASLCERGLKRAGQFTWERAARETMAIYESVLSKAGAS